MRGPVFQLHLLPPLEAVVQARVSGLRAFGSWHNF